MLPSKFDAEIARIELVVLLEINKLAKDTRLEDEKDKPFPPC
jgi:hypothetical protein